jgi:hypothetical protein
MVARIATRVGLRYRVIEQKWNLIFSMTLFFLDDSLMDLGGALSSFGTHPA